MIGLLSCKSELSSYIFNTKHRLTTFGVEGETYKVNAEGKYELLPEVKDMQQNDNDKFKKVYRLGEFCLFGHDRYKLLGTDQIESIKQMQDWGTGKLKEAISWTTWSYKGVKSDLPGWFAYRNLNSLLVDPETDSYEDILEKWSRTRTEDGFVRDEELAEILSKYAGQGDSS